MVSESLAHKKLKQIARQKLKEMGFNESEIFEEYQVKGYPRGYEIDVVGISQNKIVAIEVGNLDKLKKAVLKGEMGKIKVPFNEVIHIPYSEAILPSEMYDEGSESLAEIKRLLVATYNEEVYEKLKDDIEFQFQKCEGVDDQNFKVGRFDPWISIPTATGKWGEQLQYEINFTIGHVERNTYQITINSGTNSAVKQFLNQMILADNKEKLLELFNKLPEICKIQAGYKYKTSNRKAPPLPRNWEDTKPYQCNTLTEEQLDEMLEYLHFYFDNGSKFEQYPVISIVRADIRKEDISKLFKILKPLYKLLFTLDTFDLRRAKEISKIPNFDWYVEEGKYDMLLEEVQEQFPDINKNRLKKLIRLIKSNNN